MPQVLLQPHHIQEDRFTIDGTEAHHLLRVLRKKVNDEIEMTDGVGHRYKGVITHINLDAPSADGKIIDKLPSPHRSIHIHLFQGLPQGSKFDYVLEKATELGVSAITPFLSEKSLIKLSAEQGAAKVPRWKKLIQAASKQCKRADLPEIHAPRKLTDLAAEFSEGATLAFWEKEKTTRLKNILKDLSPKGKINVVIGPESGLSDKEVAWLVEQGAISITLGEQILRTETAGLTVLSILNYELGLF